MFGLIRRISGSIVPRADRPWEEDATSNAPKVGRKRRRSSGGMDLVVEESLSKRSRADTPSVQTQETEFGTTSTTTAAAAAVTEGMKEVTKGVKDVELDDKGKDTATGAEAVQPETVPLPDEVAGELDDTASISSTPPPAEEDKKENDQADGEVEATASIVERDASAATTETTVEETDGLVSVKEDLANDEAAPAAVETISEPKVVEQQQPSDTKTVEARTETKE